MGMTNDAESQDENDDNAHKESPQPFQMHIIFITLMVD